MSTDYAVTVEASAASRPKERDHQVEVAAVAAALEPYLQLGDQRLSGAEWSVPVNTQRWAAYLADFPTVELDVEDGRISRTTLLGLAEHARDDSSSSDACLNLFFNVLAWGIAGNWRNVSRIARSLAKDPQRAREVLTEAARASYAGEPREAYRTLAGRIASWGPAFFTKYLHFTADTADTAQVQCLILDDRVRVAWRCFAGEWLNLHSAADYERYCLTVGEIAHGRGSEPAWVEGRLYQFGRQVGTYERYADIQLALCRQHLASKFPTAADTWKAITGPVAATTGG